MSLPHGRHDAQIAGAALEHCLLVFSSEKRLTSVRDGLSGLIGRLHVPQRACESEQALARFLWARRSA